MQSQDLFGQRPLTPKCTQHMRIVEMLLKRLDADTTGETTALFRRWTVERPRDSV
jgi:hypothetical protein